MARRPAANLISTVGTSVLRNLGNLQPTDERSSRLADAYRAGDWDKVGQSLRAFDPEDKLCGAEINSVASLLRLGWVKPGTLFLLHSATEQGRAVARVLQAYFSPPWAAYAREVRGLQDDRPKVFRTTGLRNLVKEIARCVQEVGGHNVAIDATGGYKAQIAIAVVFGQAKGIDVYYKHEKFNEIISVPPMPVAFDMSLWMRHSAIFTVLSDADAPVRQDELGEEIDERIEPLIERTSGARGYVIELSPAGEVFHETFKARFAEEGEHLLPPPAAPGSKHKVRLSDHDWGGARERILSFFRKVHDVPYVTSVFDTYWHQGAPAITSFRMSRDEIEGVYSEGNWHVRFRVLTTATRTGQKEAAIADLNQRFGPKRR